MRPGRSHRDHEHAIETPRSSDPGLVTAGERQLQHSTAPRYGALMQLSARSTERSTLHLLPVMVLLAGGCLAEPDDEEARLADLETDNDDNTASAAFADPSTESGSEEPRRDVDDLSAIAPDVLVDVIVLPNGAVMNFYANPDGSMRVNEIGYALPAVSVMTSLGDDLSVPEAWLTAADKERRMPEQLYRNALAAGLIDPSERHGHGVVHSLVAVSDPQAAPGYCTQPNNTEFIDTFCDEVGYDDHECYVDAPLTSTTPVWVESLITDTAVFGWCQLYSTTEFKVQRVGCSGNWVDDFPSAC